MVWRWVGHRCRPGVLALFSKILAMECHIKARQKRLNNINNMHAVRFKQSESTVQVTPTPLAGLQGAPLCAATSPAPYAVMCTTLSRARQRCQYMICHLRTNGLRYHAPPIL